MDSVTPELGDKVVCEITGFEGIVTSKSKHLYGCDRVGIQPQLVTKESKIPDAMWFDVGAVRVLKKSVIKGDTEKPESAKTGGPSLPGQTPTRANPK